MNDHVEIIRSHSWSAGQSQHRETVLIVGTHRLQIRIEHNAYMNQSSAVVKRWSGERWERVASIPQRQMSSWKAKLSYVQDEQVFWPHFDRDEQLLITDAMAIIGATTGAPPATPAPSA